MKHASTLTANSIESNESSALTSSALAVSIEGIDFQLLAKRGLFWPDQKALFIADTHFGKEATFRSQGIAVPRGSTQSTLASISQMILECKATRLILLGDMFHARTSISNDIREALDVFFASHSMLRFTLVRGNHDRGIHVLPKNWGIEIVESGAVLASISISHFPQQPTPSTRLLLCGHLHPAYRFVSKIDSVGKLPCFWLSDRQFVLPAIGDFTGTKVIKPSQNDKTWVIAEDRVIRV